MAERLVQLPAPVTFILSQLGPLGWRASPLSFSGTGLTFPESDAEFSGTGLEFFGAPILFPSTPFSFPGEGWGRGCVPFWRKDALFP